MNTSWFLIVAAALIVPTVLGCNNVRLTACTTAYETRLAARIIVDNIRSNYQLSCEYLNDWYNCMSTNRMGCGDNRNVNYYNKHYERLRQSPYNCENIRYANSSTTKGTEWNSGFSGTTGLTTTTSGNGPFSGVVAVLGCNNLRLTACTTVHGSKLAARIIVDDIHPNYQSSCEYLNDWYNCMSTNRMGCGDNRNVNYYNKHYERLRQSPYNCENIRYANNMISSTTKGTEWNSGFSGTTGLTTTTSGNSASSVMLALPVLTAAILMSMLA